jgi:hypothetical protein
MVHYRNGAETSFMRALFTFKTVSAALDCELIFKELGESCRIVPVPRVLSSSCAYAIIAETGDLNGLCAGLRQRGADYARVFRCGILPGQGESYEVFAGSAGSAEAGEAGHGGDGHG